MAAIVRFLKSELDQTIDVVDLDLVMYILTLVLACVMVGEVGWLVWVAGMLWVR